MICQFFWHLWNERPWKYFFLLKIMILGANPAISDLEKHRYNLWTIVSHSGPVCGEGFQKKIFSYLCSPIASLAIQVENEASGAPNGRQGMATFEVILNTSHSISEMINCSKLHNCVLPYSQELTGIDKNQHETTRINKNWPEFTRIDKNQ